ncbi:hypothetical protein AVEN_263952-1 [Araneus ventricosus]|uniref:Reverse transcriptase RNase H-like domain-containing protein n=1 Tax=Araneus ventricosus TaxID=182803 RepID=A0A4Y2HNG9_ARAVE|nr:hypothetical protein AVEN_263952-1 [Araneus ventricosus]
MSKKTSPQQEKLSSYELEVLAIVEALKKFRSYLLDTKIKVVTDCDAFQKRDLTPKIARWALLEYDVVDRLLCNKFKMGLKLLDSLIPCCQHHPKSQRVLPTKVLISCRRRRISPACAAPGLLSS